jgi:hypothetical protein
LIATQKSAFQLYKKGGFENIDPSKEQKEQPMDVFRRKQAEEL